MSLHDMITKVLGQNVDEILTYFVHFLLFVHLRMITKLHGDNYYNYFYNYGQYKLLTISN
jgi:hypothetical protein